MNSIKDKLEIVGIGAVVLSLLILAYEIRQNTNTSAANAVFAQNEAARETLLLEATDPNLVMLVLKAEKNFSDLTEEEQYRYRRWVFAYLNLFESAWNNHQRGVIDDIDVEAWKESYCIYLARKSFREVAEVFLKQRSLFRGDSTQTCP